MSSVETSAYLSKEELITTAATNNNNQISSTTTTPSAKPTSDPLSDDGEEMAALSDTRPPVPGGYDEKCAPPATPVGGEGTLSFLFKGQPEGSSSEQLYSESSTPPYLRWAENMNFLLDDSEGVALFKQYLEQDQCANILEFWFACQGFKNNTDPSNSQKIYQLIKVIYRTYVRGESAVALKPATKRTITERLNRKEDLDQTIFDDAQEEVEELMRNTTYPAFLMSDLYVQYVSCGGCGSGTYSADAPDRSTSSGTLATVDEDGELTIPGTGKVTKKASSTAPLTTQNLIESCKYRTELSRQEETSGSFVLGERKPPPHPYHISWAPVSTQDSEMQSLSSDAQTDDTLSHTGSSVEGGHAQARKHRLQQRKANRRLAMLNRNTSLHHTIIPRTEREYRLSGGLVGPTKERTLAESDPGAFARLLVERLETYLRLGSEYSSGDVSYEHPSANESSALLKQPWAGRLMAIARASEEAGLHEDAQSILEDHCSRIWEKSAEETPAGHGTRSPGTAQTGAVVAVGGRAGRPSAESAPPPGRLIGVGSLTSFDSGVTPDFYTEHRHVHHHHYYQTGPNAAQGTVSSQGQGTAGSVSGRSAKTCRSRASDTSSNIDSGVSMVYDTHNPANDKVLAWILENEKSTEPGLNASKRSSSGVSSSGAAQSRSGGRSATSGQGLQAWVAQQASSAAMGEAPRQPLSQAPLMPPLTPPNPTTQLEEAKRRLAAEAGLCGNSALSGGKLAKSRTFPASGCYTMSSVGASSSAAGSKAGKLVATKDAGMAASFVMAGTPKPTAVTAEMSREPSVSNTSTLSSKSEKGKSISSQVAAGGGSSSGGSGAAPVPSPLGEALVIGYYLCGDPVPYRSQWPGKEITLGQFKQLIAKRGNYRYFFKKACDEFDTGVVHEEVISDDDVLPLWDGKIVAKVEKMD